MNDRIRRLYEMFLRVLNFMTANSADFADIPFVAAAVADLQTQTATIAALGAEKVSATVLAKDSLIFKGDAREDLRDALEDISETWRSLGEETSEAQNRFRLPQGNSDQNLIAAGKAFAADAAGSKKLFTDHGMPADFITDLEDKIAAFEQAIIAENSARGERVGTNAAFTEPTRKAKRLVDKLAPAVKRRYRANPKKLAEWLVASHIERAPKTDTKNLSEKPDA